MFRRIITQGILKNFLAIDLTGAERQIAEESIAVKYAPTLRDAVVTGALVLPAIVLLDTTVLTNALIPITMVAGTAWFAISLANVRKKFERFGLELTAAMFKSFVSSLTILALLSIQSLFAEPLTSVSDAAWNTPSVRGVAGLLGAIAILRILWQLLTASLQYDVNDAMLTGQSEAAERFFKKSLSLLHASAENLRSGKGLEVANYYIGVSFYEIFSFIRATGVLNGKMEALLTDALRLKHEPTVSQAEADQISSQLISSFVSYCVNVEGEKAHKSIENVQDELNSLQTKQEPQPIVDTRLSIIFEEIAELLDSQGESLFRAPQPDGQG